MEVIIRIAIVEDSQSISNLSNQLGYKSESNQIKNRLSKMLQDSSHCIYVAFINEKIVGWIHGFLALRVESDSFVEIGGLVVDELFRKQGIGRSLVDSVIKWAELKKVQNVRVRCNVVRIESHKFYENIGFTVNKEQKIFDKKLNLIDI